MQTMNICGFALVVDRKSRIMYKRERGIQVILYMYVYKLDGIRHGQAMSSGYMYIHTYTYIHRTGRAVEMKRRRHVGINRICRGYDVKVLSTVVRDTVRMERYKQNPVILSIQSYIIRCWEKQKPSLMQSVFLTIVFYLFEKKKKKRTCNYSGFSKGGLECTRSSSRGGKTR